MLARGFVPQVEGASVKYNMPLPDDLRDSAVVKANEREIEQTGGLYLPEGETSEHVLRGNTCGSCKHFAHAEGQKRMELEKFLPTLIREHGWQLKHLCSPHTQLGLCGLHEGGDVNNQGSTLTGALHVACDQYKKG